MRGVPPHVPSASTRTEQADPLPRHLFLKRRCTALAAKTICLPADDLCHGRASRHEDPANGILHHLILALRREPLRLAASELPKGAAQEKIEDDEEDENEDNSIHSGTPSVSPQSYGTGTAVSTFALTDFLAETHLVNGSK